jgi:GAF domain-containing protein
MNTKSHRAALEIFESTLNTRGVRASLEYLVGLTDYRFIGIWRFRDGKARAAVHFDKENPGVLAAQEVNENATYCCYVRDSRGAFMTANAMLDPRTNGHPARESVPTYCGIPLMTPDGEILGTLCHYDLVPRDPEQVDLDLVIEAASTLAHGRHVPPYPS